MFMNSPSNELKESDNFIRNTECRTTSLNRFNTPFLKSNFNFRKKKIKLKYTGTSHKGNLC